MDNIISFFTSQKNIDMLPNEIPSRESFLHTETFNNLTGGAEYNKNTYIGHLKIKKGGMKIIRDHHDKLIGKERNLVLQHLHSSLTGGKLDINNIQLYYKALEGGFIRALMCPAHISKQNCQLANKNHEMAAYKLSKNALKGGNFYTLKTFKTNAPKLYQHLKGGGKIKRLKYKRDKYQNRLSDGGSVKSDSSLSTHLSRLRNTVGTRNLNEYGGLSNDNECDDDAYDENCEYNPIKSTDIYKRNKRRVSKEIKRLSKNNEGMVKQHIASIETPVSSPQMSPQMSPQASFRLPPLGLSRSTNSSNKRKLLTSMTRKISPVIPSHIVNQSGGDALHILRSELGRL
jgi:hypothetical protein